MLSLVVCPEGYYGAPARVVLALSIGRQLLIRCAAFALSVSRLRLASLGGSVSLVSGSFYRAGMVESSAVIGRLVWRIQSFLAGGMCVSGSGGVFFSGFSLGGFGGGAIL